MKCSPAWHKPALLYTEEIGVKQSFSIAKQHPHPIPRWLPVCLSISSFWTSSFPAGYSGLRIRDLRHISKLYSSLVLIILYNNNYNSVSINNYYLYNRGRLFFLKMYIWNCSCSLISVYKRFIFQLSFLFFFFFFFFFFWFCLLLFSFCFTLFTCGIF